MWTADVSLVIVPVPLDILDILDAIPAVLNDTALKGHPIFDVPIMIVPGESCGPLMFP